MSYGLLGSQRVSLRELCVDGVQVWVLESLSVLIGRGLALSAVARKGALDSS